MTIDNKNLFSFDEFKEIIIQVISKIEKLYNIDVSCDEDILCDIYDRVEKDIFRWNIFHFEEKNIFNIISEIKICCLISYWLNTLKPASVYINANCTMSPLKFNLLKCNINEIISFLIMVGSLKFNESRKVCLKRNIVNMIIYSLKYRNLSSNELIILFETWNQHL